MAKSLPFLALLALSAAVAVGCGEEGGSPQTRETATAMARPTPVNLTFMAGFRPQANLPFVAAYVAKEKGFFHEQGLNVDIQHSAGGGEHIQLLVTGRIQFTTADAAVVLQRVADPGLPLLAIALFGQKGQQAFVALADSGIKTPKDWEGKTVGYKGRPTPDYFAILKAERVDRSKVKEVNVGFDPRVLIEGKVDVYSVFKSNEPYTIRKLGKEIVMWDAADYGVATMGLTYITSREYAERNPDVVERFLKATLRGLYYARDNVEEATDIVLKYAQGADRDHQKFILETELRDAQSALTEKNGLGWMTLEQWQALYSTLREFGGIEKEVNPADVFSDRFLKAVYDGGTLRWP